MNHSTAGYRDAPDGGMEQADANECNLANFKYSITGDMHRYLQLLSQVANWSGNFYLNIDLAPIEQLEPINTLHF